MKNKILNFIFATSLVLTGSTLTSCNKEVDDSNFPLWQQKAAVQEIYAATPKTDELMKDYYQNTIATVTDSDTYDGPFRITKAKFIESIDGDTTKFEINTTTGKMTLNIRYYSVDTPELHHPTKGAEPWALAAKQFIDERMKQAEENGWDIVIEGGAKVNESSYERMAGYVWVGPHNLNLELLEIGLGLNRYDSDTEGNERHQEAAKQIFDERGDPARYPTCPVGDLRWHYMNLSDPNWDYSKWDKTKPINIETNPAVIDRNFKYTFNYEKSGVFSDYEACNRDITLCMN